MRNALPVCLITACLAAAPAVAQWPAAPAALGPPQFTFDADVEGWVSPTGEGVLGHSTEPANVKVGAGSLQYSYQPLAGTMAAIVSQVTDASAARSLQTWLKCSVATVVVVVLTEQDGTDYTLFAHLPKDQWVRLEAPFTDFQMGDDAVDENDRLDPDQIQGVGILDAACFLQMLDGAEQLFPFDLSAERSLWVDDLALVQEALPSHRGLRQVDGRRELLVDDCDGPSLAWIPVGAATMTHERDADDGYVRLTYNLVDHPFPVAGALVGGVRAGYLAGLSAIRLRVRAATASGLFLMLEESGGARYVGTAMLAGGGTWEDATVYYHDFQLSDDTTDANGRLDADTVKMLGLVDPSGMLGAAFGPQQLDVSEVAVELE